MNKETLFLPSTKMVDIITRNYSLLTVLPRFEIPLGFGEKRVTEVCSDRDVDENIFLLVCNIYTFDRYIPSRESLNIELGDLIEYLKRSHAYYLERMSVIEQHLNIVIEQCSESQRELLHRFFEEYRNEVVNHFRYEEETVFPYIYGLINGTVSEYHIHSFEENHSNIEDKLSDLKNIIIKYLPSDSGSPFARNELLFDLFLIADDIDKHTLIEEHVLIPCVEQLESKYEA